jgi:predicted DNA-binding transcriptional regulator YafY
MPQRLPKDLVLLQLALVLQAGERLSYERLQEEFKLTRRTAERYLQDLKAVGLPLVSVRRGREAEFALDHLRARMSVEAIDVPPAAARNLSLLLVAASLLPTNLGVREAVDQTVRAALRVRGMKAAAQLRAFEDAVVVLENDAKDYTGRAEVFHALVEAVLVGQAVTVTYQSPKKRGPRDATFWPATVGLYKGGLYVLGVPLNDDGHQAAWWALERMVGVARPAPAPKLTTGIRLAALAEARRRWGPARPSAPGAKEQVITLHFSAQAAPYVRARPWHGNVEIADWDDGGVRVSVRLTGETPMFESWVMSWGKEVQILRPRVMAERVAAELAAAAAAHRTAAQQFEDFLNEDL